MPETVSPNTGESLADRLECGRMPALEGLDVFVDVCRALAMAHERGTVYGDLNPENIHLGSPGYVQLLDSSAPQLLAYLSPEQARDEDVDERTDIYALGAIGYEIFLGVTPFAATDGRDAVAALLSYPPELPSVMWHDIPPSLEKLLVEMLAKQPQRRPDIAEILGALYAARGELCDDYEPFVAGEGTKSRSDISFVTVPVEKHEPEPAVAAAAPPINWSSPHLSRWGTIAGALSVVIVVFGVVLVVIGDKPSGDASEPDEIAQVELPPSAPVSRALPAGAPVGTMPEPTTGFVKIMVNAPDARVLVGGDIVDLPGDGSSIELAPGEHEFEIAADGYVTEQQTIALSAGEHAAIDVTLERAEPSATVRKTARKSSKSRSKSKTSAAKPAAPAPETSKPSDDTKTFDSDGTIDPFAKP